MTRRRKRPKPRRSPSSATSSRCECTTPSRAGCRRTRSFSRARRGIPSFMRAETALMSAPNSHGSSFACAAGIPSAPSSPAMDPTTTRRTRRTSTSCTRCCAWSATRRRMPRSTRILPRSRRRIESQTRRRASRRTPRSSRRKTFRIRVARRSIGRCSSAAGSSWRRVGSLTGRRMRFSTTRSFRASARGWRRLATAPTSPARGRS
mmetsp:Transcript_7845/g.34609  ORF Transcript_7845/g.34609 Transcript_7845/m.34609 type:complete len:206 (+) Transcript_7845:107-724(+)